MNDDFDFSWMERSFQRADENHRRREELIEKLRCEPCMVDASVGDRVLISAGLIGAGRGFLDELLECEVVAVSSSAYKIRVQKPYDKEPSDTWVLRYIIADVVAITPADRSGT